MFIFQRAEIQKVGVIVKKAVIGDIGYCKICIICGKPIENEMYESTILKFKSHKTKYFHVKCYTKEKLQNRKV